MRRYLTGPAPSREPAPSCLEPFRDYRIARFAEDAHVDGTVLHREVTELGFDRSYVARLCAENVIAVLDGHEPPAAFV